MIKHIKCDIFESGADVILHQVNCQGVMGSGIAKQVREKYPLCFASYKKICDGFSDKKKMLGMVQCIRADDGKFICNMFAQETFGYDGKCYTDYNALKECLEQVRDYSIFDNQIIAIPYLMGCHRGGGDWNVVYKMIEEIFQDHNVLICEYNGG